MSHLSQIALVIGMHRSGTSALAALISRLGFDLGRNLLPGNEFNAEGYYENESIVQFHDEILKHLGSSWHDLRFLPEKSFQKGWIEDASQKLAGILRQEFGDASRVVIKDPRISRLLPLWHQFAVEQEVDLKFILVGRHPLQVSYSLASRDGFSRQKSLLLWLQYNLVAERKTREERRLLVRYRDLLEAPANAAQEIAQFLEIAGESKAELAAAAVDATNLHYATTSEIFSEQVDLQRWTSEVWDLLFVQSLKGADTTKRLDRISTEIQKRLSILPEEARGLGEYEAAQLKRTVSTLREQRDQASRRAETAEESHGALRQRYQERDQLLQALMLHRDEARKQVETTEAQVQRLRENYQKQNEALRDVMQQRDSAQSDLKQARERYKKQNETLRDVMQQRDAARQEVETATAREASARTQAEAAGKLTKQLEYALSGAASQITARETEHISLVERLESLRRQWLALPFRRTLKEFAGPFATNPPDLLRSNSETPNFWNKSYAGYRLGLSIFPDLEQPHSFLVEGWILPEKGDKTLATIRLVSDRAERRKAKTGLRRVDVTLLYPEERGAGQAGFAIHNLKEAARARWRLEVRTPTADWIPLALIDFSAVGAHYLRDIQTIVTSQLFDHAWYARRYHLIGEDLVALISHYLREGAARGYFPNSLFDTTYYFESNRDLLSTGENPLLHYLRSVREGDPRQPNPWFEPKWYLRQNSDVAAAKLEPLSHYLRHGCHERRNPSPSFDISAYLARNPDVARSRYDPLSHYLHFGSAEGREIIRVENDVRWVFESNPPANEGKKNILLAGHVLAPKMFGSERSLLELIQLIDRDRFNIFCSFPQGGGPLLESVKPFASGIAVFPYKWWRGDVGETDGFVSHFENILRARRIDLVHVNSIVLRDPLIAAQRLGVPSVLHLREIIAFDPDLAERIGLPVERIVKEVSSRSDFVIANSRFTEEQQAKPGRSFVLYNTADTDALDLPPRKGNDALRVAMLSSNLPKKGVEDFFIVAREAERRHDQLEFWLVGPETDWVREQLSENGGCPPNVRCIGYVEEPAMVLREVDTIVNLSNFAESFGRSVAEGMLARRPAVVYEHGALPELIRDGVDGFVVPFRDTNAILERLNRLAQNRPLLEQMGETARERGLKCFSRAKGADVLNQIYTTILEQRPQEPPKSSESESAEPAGLSSPVSRPMRIGYFLWHFPVPSETFVLNELRDFVRLGHDVVVFCKESPHKDFQPDFPVEWRRVKSPEDLAAKIKESGREIVHSHFVYPTVTQFLWPACEIAEVPFTFIAHAVDIFRHENAAQNRLGEIARSPWCRRVFAPGTFHRDFFVQNGVPEEKIIVSPQGILFNAYEAQPIAPRLQKPRMSIFAIHRFIEKKGLHDAIRAAKELAPHGISLHLYGYGPLEQSYRDLVAELGLQNVFFPGPVKDRNHMISVFREHDLFLCPCIRAADGDMDGIPTILIEAMASHVPVVASRISSIPDLVIDGITGYLSEAGDVTSLTQSILRFYREPVGRVQAVIENAREHVRKHFDVMKSNRTLVRTWSGEGLDVILVTFNATAEVREVIDRLYRFTKTPFQLYIVDNGSEPETLEYLRSIEATHGNAKLLPQGKNLFVGPGTNKGIEAGGAPCAVYLCSREGYVLGEGWDQAILDYMDDNPAVGLAGTLGYSPSYFTGADYIEQLEPFPRFRNQAFAAENRDRPFRHVQGGMFVVRRAMFESIGGFSEAVPHNHTDVEYSYYAESCGWQLGQIPDLVIIYQKSRPLLTARMDESVYAVHPGSLTIAPLLDTVVRLQANFCNVCGNAVSFAETGKSVCSHCGSTPFHRSLYRYLAESTFTYRRLFALCVDEFRWHLPEWEKMFGGRATGYDELVSGLNAEGRIDHPSGRFDLIVLRLPDSILRPPAGLLQETARILKPGGHLLYFQLYGVDSILDSAPAELSNPDQVADMLASHSFQIEARVRYASAAVHYSEHEIFVCRSSLPG